MSTHPKFWLAVGAMRQIGFEAAVHQDVYVGMCAFWKMKGFKDSLTPLNFWP
jgi:hypothetical protein